MISVFCVATGCQTARALHTESHEVQSVALWVFYGIPIDRMILKGARIADHAIYPDATGSRNYVKRDDALCIWATSIEVLGLVHWLAHLQTVSLLEKMPCELLYEVSRSIDNHNQDLPD